MDVEYADILQVRRGRNGKFHDVQNDVLDIVRQIKEIDPNLSVKWNEYGHYFTIVEKCRDGAERRVTNVNQLDQRLVTHLRQISQEKWDAGAEADKMDAKADREKKHAFREQIGEASERLQHALRRDLQDKHRIYIP